MTNHDAMVMAYVELRKYPKLDDWHVKISARLRRALGRCSYRRREIELGAEFIKLNPMEKIKNTILHEVAHALTPGSGHGPKWTRTALQLGCTAERCSIAEMPKAFTGTCPTCGKVCGRSYRRLRVYCSGCVKDIGYCRETFLVWNR